MTTHTHAIIGYETPLQRQLREDAERRKDASRTIRSIARYHGVTYEALMSPTRSTQDVAAARAHAMAVVRWSTGWTYSAIARVFHRYDHTTVINSVRRWEAVLNCETYLVTPKTRASIIHNMRPTRRVLEDRPAVGAVLGEVLPPAAEVAREAYPDHDVALRESRPCWRCVEGWVAGCSCGSEDAEAS